MTQKRTERSPQRSRPRATEKRNAARKPKTQLRKQLSGALTHLRDQELVRTADTNGLEFIFKHALVVDTAQSTLLHGEYKRLNLLVAQAYEKVHAGQTMNEYAAVLAQHYDAAGDDAKTLQYAARAGDLAASLYANAEAIAFYTHAIDHAQKVSGAAVQLSELFSKRGRAYELMGSYDAALANYSEMEQVAQTCGERALELEALMARATIHSTPNAKFDPARAQVLSEQSLVLARELNDRPAQAKVLWNLLLLAHFSGKSAEAIGYGERSIALARELQLREQLAYSLNDTGRAYFITQQITQGLDVLREAQMLWRELDNKPMLADNLNTLATSVSTIGEIEEGLTLAREAYQLGKEIHNPWSMAHSCMAISFIYIERGDVADALMTMQEAWQLAEQVGFQIAVVSMRMLSALTYASLGNLSRAVEIVRPREHGSAWDANMLGVLAQLQITQGELEQARATVQASHAVLHQGAPNPFVSGMTLVAEVELALAEHKYSLALELIDLQLAALVKERFRATYITALRLKALALRGQGMPEQAYAVAQAARAQAEQAGSRRLLWKILALLGDLQVECGNGTEAALLYAQAREILAYIAAHVPAEYHESFLKTPDVFRVMHSFPGSAPK